MGDDTPCCVTRIDCIFLDLVHAAHREAVQSLAEAARNRQSRRNRAQDLASILKNPDHAAVIAAQAKPPTEREAASAVPAPHRTSQRENHDLGECSNGIWGKTERG